MTTENAIVVVGARAHNLRDVGVALPRGRLVVLTGPSGSGKSSLAFDTIHAEARRRLVESLSGPARAFVAIAERPQVDSIDGLPPTVAVDQRPAPPNPRSTVATITEVHDHLRLLYARVAVPHCPDCGAPVRRSTPEQVIETAMALGEGRKLLVLAPLVRGKKGTHVEALEKVRLAGLLRARIDGAVHEIAEAPKLAKGKAHDVEAVVDRLVVREGVRQRLSESVGLALKLGEGTVLLSDQGPDGTWRDQALGTKFACPSCGTALPEVEPRTFSPNSPHGACPTCGGLGRTDDGTTCPDCQGQKLGRVGRSARLGGLGLPALLEMTAPRALEFLNGLTFGPTLADVARRALEPIGPRLECLERVGLGYLTLDRGSDTLSGGELQRVRLSAALGSGLVGVAYVLDEPTAGLHPRDVGRLLDVIRDLRDAGNSVLVVEHDEAVIRAADWLVDLGPGAGPLGGEIVAEGTPTALVERVPGASLTALRLREGPPIVAPRPAPGERGVRVLGATERNLKEVDTFFPLGALTAVTGVSGSGKSTLVMEVLAPVVHRHLFGGGREPGRCRAVEGAELFDKLAIVDQSPIGANSRSTPATYVGTFDEIRRAYARTREAKARGMGPARFSFNAKGGRCPSCLGLGERRHRVGLLPELWSRCEACGGGRYAPASLEARFKGRTIAETLALTVDEAREAFMNVPPVRQGLDALALAGLGYLGLGQSAATLSGGEAQRTKLAAELARPETGTTLYLFDEPTTGLHVSDVAGLLVVLRALADRGHAVVVIEHHMDVVRASDWVVDLGPEGGDAGGRLMAMGTVAEVLAQGQGATALALAMTFGDESGRIGGGRNDP